MKELLNDEVLKTLTTAHKRLWDSMLAVLPRFQASAAGTNLWRETFLKNLAACEQTVNNTLKAEAAWLQQWTKQMAARKDVSGSMSEWAQQVEQMMQHWLQTQRQLWEEYFRLLKTGGKEFPEPASSKVNITVATGAEPTVASPPVESEPALIEASESPVESDDLQTISGLGPANEKRLNDYGIVSYRQLAGLTEDEIAYIEKSVLKGPPRIRRYRWIEQAKEQHFLKYHERL